MTERSLDPECRWLHMLDAIKASPYRVFFPMGLLAAVYGVLLWPIYFSGRSHVWPLEIHARMMIAGFGGCFIVGFLGTAGPRLLGSAKWCRFELLLHFSIGFIALVTLAFGNIHAADLWTGLWLAGVVVSMLFRLVCWRSDMPPPGMPAALAGLLLGSISAFALSMESFHTYSLEMRQLWRLLFFQAFPWLPVIGVAPFLLPRFMGKASRHAFKESRNPPSGWWSAFWQSSAAAVSFLIGIGLEADGYPRAGTALRLAAIVLHFSLNLSGLYELRGKNAIARALQFSIFFGMLGWIGSLAFPLMRIASLHLMFIGGLGLMMLAVATRVIWGHGGRGDLFSGRLAWMHWVYGLVMFTAVTRFSADFMLKVKISHYEYAAYLWAGVIGLWVFKLAAGFRRPKPPQLLPPLPARRAIRSTAPLPARTVFHPLRERKSGDC